MKTLRQTKLVQEGEYAAQVEIELIETEDEWSPFLSVEDALKLDQVRQALIQKDLRRASKFGKVYRLMPVAT